MIDLTPTKKQYIKCLKVIIQGSKIEEDREWALGQLVELANGATCMNCKVKPDED
jgi:hypothetical protein